VSDVPVAAFLSGGLDSSAVVASMAVAGEGPPHAFTARYFGSGAADTDETELARQLARRYDARLTIVDIRPNLRESFEPIVRALDEPHADDSAVPTWALSQAVGSSYKVALTGIGGDELFAGYWRHLGLLAMEQFGRLPRALRRSLDGALARAARAARRSQSRRAGLPAPGPTQTGRLEAEASAEARARRTAACRSPHRAQTRLRRPHRGMAARRAPAHAAGRALSEPHHAPRLLRSRGGRSPHRRALRPPPQP